MKQIYLLFLILFSKGIIQAQPVFPTYEENPVWCVKQSVFGVPQNEYNIELGTDTLICDRFYTKVIRAYSPENRIVIGFIRQEGKKVYETSSNCRETLLYDFSLQQGDTIRHYSDDSHGLGIVSKVDTLNYHGIRRKSLTIEYPQSGHFPMLPIKRTWIEGIGDTFHPFEHILCLATNCEFTSEVLCFSNKNGIQYGACTEPCNVDNDTITMQPVFPTYEEKPVWCVEVSNALSPYEKFYSSLEMLPGTMICGKLYYPLASRKLSSTGNRDTTTSITGYVRQEGKRVYQLLNNCEEIILYDFSLSVGDSLVYNYANQELKAIVNKISFQEFNGVSRRVFEVIYGSNVAFEVRFWVEGLGDRFYPLLQIECFTGAACDGSTIARCLSTKNGIQYGACTEPCNIDNTTDTDDIIKNKFVMHLSRNPVRVQEQLNVHLDSTKPVDGQLYIVNIFGQILYYENLQLAGYEEHIELDWAPAAAGIYWLVWQSKDGSRQSLKLVVQ